MTERIKMNETTELRLKAGSTDEWYTPFEAVIPILQRVGDLDYSPIIWCPFDTEQSEFVRMFDQNGYRVEFSHIDNGQDFFTYEPKKWDILVSNPPYSKRNDILLRAFSLNKPFALLMNTNGLFDSAFRYDMFRDNDFTLFYLKGRVNYMREYGKKEKSSPPFQSAYICHKLFNEKIAFESKQGSLL